MDPSDAIPRPTAVGAAPAVDPLVLFRRRARNLFTILAFWSAIVGGAGIIVGSADRFGLSIIVTAVGLVAAVALFYVLVMALAERRPWADRATVIVCTILVVGGVARSVIRSAGGAIEVPLDAIGAALVLAVAPAMSAPWGPGDGRRLRLLAAATVVALYGPVIGTGIHAGSLLGATPDDVSLRVEVDCFAIVADPQAPVVIRASWQWAGGEILPGGNDGLVVRWSASTDAVEADGGGMFVDGDVRTTPSDAVWLGSGSPASALTDTFEADGNARVFGIDVGGFGLIDGHVVIPLRPVSPDVRHGSITVIAGYAHLDHWIKQSEAGCDW